MIQSSTHRVIIALLLALLFFLLINSVYPCAMLKVSIDDNRSKVSEGNSFFFERPFFSMGQLFPDLQNPQKNPMVLLGLLSFMSQNRKKGTRGVLESPTILTAPGSFFLLSKYSYYFPTQQYNPTSLIHNMGVQGDRTSPLVPDALDSFFAFLSGEWFFNNKFACFCVIPLKQFVENRGEINNSCKHTTPPAFSVFCFNIPSWTSNFIGQSTGQVALFFDFKPVWQSGSNNSEAFKGSRRPGFINNYHQRGPRLLFSWKR